MLCWFVLDLIMSRLFIDFFIGRKGFCLLKIKVIMGSLYGGSKWMMGVSLFVIGSF